MFESARDAALDTLKMAPFLLGIYLVIEWMEGRFGDAMVRAAKSTGRSGPIVAAIVGCVPQCGFSSVGSALYARRAISLGTLLAVFLSTSDEALPILLSRPASAGLVGPIVLAKLAVAVIVGMAFDLLPRRRTPGAEPEPAPTAAPASIDHHAHCEHEHAPLWRRAAMHTGQVAAFVFAVTFALNHALAVLGPQGLARVMLAHSALQPPAAALVGLIPNCAGSVAITQALIEGGIGIGAAVAGLCAAAGVGLIVLVRENRPATDTVRVVGLLYVISAAVGLAIQHFAG